MYYIVVVLFMMRLISSTLSLKSPLSYILRLSPSLPSSSISLSSSLLTYKRNFRIYGKFASSLKYDDDSKKRLILSLKDLTDYAKDRNFNAAMDVYKDQSLWERKDRFFSLFLSVCYKAEHLSHAMHLFNEMAAANIAPSEPAYLALIRCNTDNDDIDTSLGLIKHMIELDIEPKLRTYHPILEAICTKKKDIYQAVELVHHMKRLGVVLRSEQLTLLLECAHQTNALKVPSMLKEFEDIMEDTSKELLGMESAEMKKLVSVFSNKSNEEVDDLGILVQSKDDIVGDIIVNNMNTNGSVIALNDSYVNTQTAFSDTLCSPVTSDPTLPIVGSSVLENVVQINEKYIIVDEAGKDAGAPLPARLVDISNSTCLCPNCGDKLMPLLLSEDERHRVRVALMKIASMSSLQQCKNLQAFDNWLKERDEFVHIVDGANVAYARQNFQTGKFSYRQIELVVDQLLLKGEKVLVLLPYPYAQRIVPNSAKHRKGRHISYLTEDDQRILDKFEKAGILYVVPQGANDDWYWIFITVTENRKKPAYVITNDLMRDHRLAFLEPRPFLRWRTTQIVHFDFSKAVEAGTSDPETFFREPAKFSREIQRTSNKRWHLPATDKRAWLCLDLDNHDETN